MENKLTCYRIQLKGYNDDGTYSLVSAETRSQAKYHHYLGLDGLFGSFKEYLAAVKSCCKVKGNELQVTDQKQKDFDRTKLYRGVPKAEIGMRVKVGRMGEGYIVGANDSCNFDVLMNGVIWNVHPNSEVTYYDKDGTVVYEFGRNGEKT